LFDEDEEDDDVPVTRQRRGRPQRAAAAFGRDLANLQV
jgi:hypothetical protein